MTSPHVCAKCGTSFSAGSVTELKCAVCGGVLEPRTSAKDPKPSKTGDAWLWLAAFPWEFILLGSAVLAGLAAFVKS